MAAEDEKISQQDAVVSPLNATDDIIIRRDAGNKRISSSELNKSVDASFAATIRNIRFITFLLVASATDVAVAADIGGDFVIPFTGVIVQDDANPDFCSAFNQVAGVTGTMVVDVHLNGTTIMTTNKLDIETAEKSSSTAATQPDLSTTVITKGDSLTFDIDAIHTTPAKVLKVTLAIRVT